MVSTSAAVAAALSVAGSALSSAAPALTAVAAVASAGVGIASAAGAFTPDPPDLMPAPRSSSDSDAALAARNKRLKRGQDNRTVFGGAPLGPASQDKPTALFGPGATKPGEAA